MFNDFKILTNFLSKFYFFSNSYFNTLPYCLKSTWPEAWLSGHSNLRMWQGKGELEKINHEYWDDANKIIRKPLETRTKESYYFQSCVVFEWLLKYFKNKL